MLYLVIPDPVIAIYKLSELSVVMMDIFWLKTPAGLDSWGFFDLLLGQAHVVGTPGSGFGAAGEGYFRLSAFNSRANVEEAMARIQEALAG